MSFLDVIKKYPAHGIDAFVYGVKPADVQRVLAKDILGPMDYLTLLSPAASEFLEQMARRAHELTVRQFGKTILLFTPMYLSDHCVNQCRYCGFNKSVAMERSRLSPDEVDLEASAIAETGLKHILILTGESRNMSGPDYLKDCVRRLSRYFTSIAIEIYPLETLEYRELIEEGVDAFTLYQETYNEALYDTLHVKGPKKNYHYRLGTPERACIAGMRAVNVGALLGLDVFHRDAFMTGLHASYLQKSYPAVDISVSFPRMRPHSGEFQADHPVSDRALVQAVTALRLFMPRAGITLSTRETAAFRNNVFPLGVTRMSAGSSTRVGGHSGSQQNKGQFDISDERSVEEMENDLKSFGYQPVYKDWQPFEQRNMA